jgi:hypothetical protein
MVNLATLTKLAMLHNSRLRFSKHLLEGDYDVFIVHALLEP